MNDRFPKFIKPCLMVAVAVWQITLFVNYNEVLPRIKYFTYKFINYYFKKVNYFYFKVMFINFKNYGHKICS